MRILVVNWQDAQNPHAGGAETHLHEVFGRIARGGAEVDLLCSGFEGAAERDVANGIAIHRVGRRYTFPLHARRYYTARLAGRDYDVVVEDLNKIPLFTPRWGARRVVALVHHLFGATAFREASPAVAAVVWLLERPVPHVYRHVAFEAVSESTADDLVSRGIPRGSIRVIHNGVDVDRLTPDPSARSRIPIFAYIGRLRRYKRLDVLLRAFARLAHSDAALEIAGAGPDRARLERLAHSLDLDRRVKFLGFISESEKVALLRRAWATLLASPKEGWGIGNVESAACGTPVIAFDAPGVRDSVVNGQTGYLVRPNAPRPFADAMQRLIATPAAVEAMGIAARRFAERFTWERAARDTAAHLQQVVTGAHAD